MGGVRGRGSGIQPHRTIWRVLDGFARRSAPTAACGMTILLLGAPSGLPGAAELLPGLLLASVFFWSVFRPASMGAGPVFLLGLLCDLLGEAPPGMTALLLLGTHAAAAANRQALSRLGFMAMWTIFSMIATFACGLQWGLMSLFRLQGMPPAPAFFEAALACSLYPLLSAGFTWAHRSIADPCSP